MLTFLDTITGILAPHECLGCGIEGSLLCSDCIQMLPELPPRCYRCGSTKLGAQTCRQCRSYSPLENVHVVTVYEGFAEALVKRLKFERALQAAHVIALAMKDIDFTNDFKAIIPVPTATSRVRVRGYDQSVMIANELGKMMNIPVIHGLERLGQQRQTGSKRTERLKQIEGAFEPRPKKLHGVKSVLLIDDVLTTGATLESAARTLKRSGIKHVSAAVFARAE